MDTTTNIQRPDARLAYETLDLINQNRLRLDMDSWASDGTPTTIDDLTLPVDVSEIETVDGENVVRGTTACFAGWVCALRGYAVDPFGNVYRHDNGQYTGVSGDIEGFAADLLGIDYMVAHRLFFDVSNDELDQRMEEIFGPRPAPSEVTS